MMKQLEHVYESQQFIPEDMEGFFQLTKQMKKVWRAGGDDSLRGCYGVNLFYQASTRTHASFRWAQRFLGINVVFDSENAGAFTSAVKGETLQDTIEIHSRYAPNPEQLVIVLRHPDGEAPVQAMVHAGKSHIVNAGCGKVDGQHPTQALIDLYTIVEERPQLRRPTIMLVGDLRNGRTARSLAYLTPKVFPKARIFFVSPESLKISEGIKQYLTRHEIAWDEATRTADFNKMLAHADVIYMTRVQFEDLDGDDRLRFNEYQRAFQLSYFTSNFMKEDSLILHPLPRNLEILPEVDEDTFRAAYFRQALNGVPVRMAVLRMLLAQHVVSWRSRVYMMLRGRAPLPDTQAA